MAAPPPGAEVASVEETFKRIQSHRGVLGALVVNADGVAVRSTFDPDTTVQYAALVSQLTFKARGAVKRLGPDDELRFLRVRSRRHEIMVAPEFDKGREYQLVVVQDPSAE
jgi:dynein light chain roadblock-type